MSQIFNLWTDKIPYWAGGEIPTLTYYPAKEKRGRGTVIICPGGAYAGRAMHEGKVYAEFFNANGLDAFVLDYRVAPNKYPAALSDARRAVRFVRHNAARFGIDPNKIAIMGSSAGGHLAAHAATYIGELSDEVLDETDRESYAPNAQILCYPVIDKEGHRGSYENLLGDRLGELYSEVTPYNIATKETPPAFIWHTAGDEAVDVKNTYRYVTRLSELSVPTELHIFPYGRHGLGLADADDRINPHVAAWSGLMIKWLELFGFYDI